MSDKTHIEWTDATWNPVTGCTKVSAGCKHCYAERDWARLTANPATRYYGRAFTDVQCHQDVLELPLRWRRPRRIFVNSMSDLFHDAVPDEFIDEVFAVMARTPQHVFQVLTKRPERMRDYLSKAEGMVRDLVKYEPAAQAMQWPLPNVWIGVSVEDQAAADERIPLLLQTPAAVRWISAEPLLGPMLLDGSGYHVEALAGWWRHLDWVVVGGESGPQARPAHPAWVRTLRDQCDAAGVPFLFKQWGELLPITSATNADGLRFWPDDGGPTGRLEGLPATAIEAHGREFSRVGKKAAGRLLDGVEHNGYPS